MVFFFVETALIPFQHTLMKECNHSVYDDNYNNMLNPISFPKEMNLCKC